VKPIRLHPQAIDEAEEAIAYLNEERDGLGDEFWDELEEALEHIRRHPKAFSPYTGGYRKYLMGKRFTYQIFYVEYETYVWVASVYHARRQPDTWKDRTPG
jgi:plasmid stabilization system protein ParE